MQLSKNPKFNARNRKIQLTQAFKDLRKLGYFARQNFQCCQSCGWSAVPDDKAERAVFYHGQDKQRIDKDREVYLAWAGNGEEIVNVIKATGLNVEWEGTSGRRIRVIL